MRINRTALTALGVATSSCLGVARGFTTSSPMSNRIVATAMPTFGKRSLFNTRGGGSVSSSSVAMIFGDLFSSLGGGGGYSSKIDYSVQDFPVPQLGAEAMEGKVSEEIERNGKTYKLATFAGGCFWGLELAYQRVPGVEYTGTGYTQGPETQPTYDQVCAGATKHTEAIIVLYDPSECSYESLLDTFFGRVDPLTVNGQGNDRGPQYRTGVYFHSKEQEEIATARFALEQEKYPRKKIASECLAAQPFWPAEKYHQQYLEKGGRFSAPQSAEKGCTETIRCYG